VDSPFNISQFVFIFGLMVNFKDTLNGNVSTNYRTVMINIPLIDHSRRHMRNNCRNMVVEFIFFQNRFPYPVGSLCHWTILIYIAWISVFFYHDWNYLLLLICLRVVLQPSVLLFYFSIPLHWFYTFTSLMFLMQLCI
jgi:hypothetical protein